MRKTLLLAAITAATALSTPALAAGNPDGHWQVKLLATGVLPDGKMVSTSDTTHAILPAGANTTANDNVVPTLAVEYYFNPNISVETICCLTQHHVSGAGTIPSFTNIVDHVMILPATFTLKYHLNAGAIRPYVGVGPTLFLVLGEKPGVSAQSIGVTRVKMSNEVGVALQAGVDIAVNDSGMGISLDAKRYFVRSTAHYFAGSTEVLSTRHKLDPWVVSGGVYFRF